MPAPGFEPHDHGTCISTGVAQARAICAQTGLQFTPVRQRVLELLLTAHRAMGAYDILEHLHADGLAAQPPVAYRALDFLVKNGFAHKIERLNAFIACSHAGTDHAPVFLICGSCDAVAETAWQPHQSQLSRAADKLGFSLDAVVVEAVGTCPNCRESTDA